MTRYSNVQQYINAATEIDLAAVQRRSPLIAPLEVVRLGEAAFSGPKGEATQSAIDHLIDLAVNEAIGAKPAGEPTPDIVEALGATIAPAMLEYAQAVAGVIVARESKRANPATSPEVREQIRAMAAEEVTRAAVAMSAPTIADAHRGIYQSDTSYTRGDVVMLDGSSYVAMCDNPSEQPGPGAAWRMLSKAGRAGRDRR